MTWPPGEVGGERIHREPQRCGNDQLSNVGVHGAAVYPNLLAAMWMAELSL